MERTIYSASLITQGKFKFYSLTMPIDVLAKTAFVRKGGNAGFQRSLDEKRARSIASYIDSGLGTIPTAIVLSAQDTCSFEYNSRRRSVSFLPVSTAFLILDGQHRVYGFSLATTNLRVPVVVYSGLNLRDECRLFIDINTTQRPVPNELLLDIKKLAEDEIDDDSFLGSVFDLLHAESGSPLGGLLSPRQKASGKVSRVTYNAAMRRVLSAFESRDVRRTYEVMSAYYGPWVARLSELDSLRRLTTPAVFRAVTKLFLDVAPIVAAKGDLTVAGFQAALKPVLEKLDGKPLSKTKVADIYDMFRNQLKKGFVVT